MRWLNSHLTGIAVTMTVMALAILPARAPRAGATQPTRADDERFMRLAIQAAADGVRGGGYPFGACIVREGKILATAANTLRQGEPDVTAHAEMEAIRAACRKFKTLDLSGATIYATGEPCVMCFGACYWANISRIVYGASMADLQKAGIRQLPITDQQLKEQGKVAVELDGGFLRDESLALLKLWSERQKEGAGEG